MPWCCERINVQQSGSSSPTSPILEPPPHAGATISPEEHSNYSSFKVAFLTTFQILSGEDWNAVMYSAMNSWPNSPYLAIPYFLIVTAIGSFVVLNLFVVIMLSAFDDEVVDGSDSKVRIN